MSMSDDPALAHRVDARHRQVRLRAVAHATPDGPQNNSVGGVDEVANQFEGVGIPGLAHLLELAHDRLPTYVWPRLRPSLRGPPDDARIARLTKGVHVPRVPRLEGGSHDLHVLLRHRPPSIPPPSYSRSPTAARAS